MQSSVLVVGHDDPVDHIPEHVSLNTDGISIRLGLQEALGCNDEIFVSDGVLERVHMRHSSGALRLEGYVGYLNTHWQLVNCCVELSYL